jgi:DsbC/DsbD-like thiol-disulfide interchange protein
MRLNAVFRLAVAALAFLLAGAPALALEGAWVQKAHSQVRVVALGPSAEDPDAVVLGIHLRLQQGWETYWRSHGDAGVPPDFRFDETENVDELYVDWPLPTKKVTAGMTTYVYKDEVLLPVTVYPHDRTQPIKFRMKITYAVCREVCMLEEADLALDVRADHSDDRLTELFAKNAARMPVLENKPDLSVERVALGPMGLKPQIEVVARAATPWVDPQIIIEAEPGFAFKPATITPTLEGRRIVLRAEYSHPAGLLLQEGATVVVTVYDVTRAIERMMLVFPPE